MVKHAQFVFEVLRYIYPNSYTYYDICMMTSSNENIFRVTGHLCGEFTGPRWFPRTEASDAELWSFFDLRLNKRLSKRSWGWWIETLLRPLWRHCNDASRSHWVVGTYLIAFHKYLVSSIKYEETVFLWTASTLHRHCTHLLRVS